MFNLSRFFNDRIWQLSHTTSQVSVNVVIFIQNDK
jgi:hypothetical protein